MKGSSSQPELQHKLRYDIQMRSGGHSWVSTNNKCPKNMQGKTELKRRACDVITKVIMGV